jgi:hypothetical protein
MLTRDFWSRHAWMVLLVLVVILGFFAGIGDITKGLDADPAIITAVTGLTPDEVSEASDPLARMIDVQIRSGGLHILTICVLWAVIVAVPFRRRERWAWFTMWTLPIWGAIVALSFWFVELVPDGPIPPPAISGWVFFIAGSLALLASMDIVRAAPGRGDVSTS